MVCYAGLLWVVSAPLQGSIWGLRGAEAGVRPVGACDRLIDAARFACIGDATGKATRRAGLSSSTQLYGMQRTAESPQPEPLYERLEACASGLAETALGQAAQSLSGVARESAACTQDSSPAERAGTGGAFRGLAACGLAHAPADSALGHQAHGSSAEPRPPGLCEAVPAGRGRGSEQLLGSALLALEGTAGASPGLYTPHSSRAGVLEDQESSCELGRASSGSGAGSPASDAPLCGSSVSQLGCKAAAWRAGALERAQPSKTPGSGLCHNCDPDPDPDPGIAPASPRSDGRCAARGSAMWQLSPEHDPRPERRRWLSQSACELGGASSSAGGGAPAALPAALNGLRDSDKENVAALAAACGLAGSRAGGGISADGGGLGREGALLASEFAGPGSLLGFQAAPGGGRMPAGDSSPGPGGAAWGALERLTSAILTDPGSQPSVDGALGSGQACHTAAQPGEYRSGGGQGSGEACAEAEERFVSQSGAASPAAGRGTAPGTEAASAGAAASGPGCSAHVASGEQRTASSGVVTAVHERSASGSRGGSTGNHILYQPQALHGSNVTSSTCAACLDSPGTGAAAAAPERSASEACARAAGEQALPQPHSLRARLSSNMRPDVGMACSDCGSASGDADLGFRIARGGGMLLLSSSSELVPLELGRSGGCAGSPRAADGPGEVHSAPEARPRGRGAPAAARRSLDGSWGVPPADPVLRCGWVQSHVDKWTIQS